MNHNCKWLERHCQKPFNKIKQMSIEHRWSLKQDLHCTGTHTRLAPRNQHLHTNTSRIQTEAQLYTYFVYSQWHINKIIIVRIFVKWTYFTPMTHLGPDWSHHHKLQHFACTLVALNVPKSVLKFSVYWYAIRSRAIWSWDAGLKLKCAGIFEVSHCLVATALSF